MPTKAETEERRARAVGLRRSGLGYEAIGREMNVSTNTAWRLVQASLRETRSLEVQSLRALQGEQIDALVHALWPKAMKGSATHALAIVRCLERQSRLFAMDVQVDAGAIDNSVAEQAIQEWLRSLGPRPSLRIVGDGKD